VRTARHADHSGCELPLAPVQPAYRHWVPPFILGNDYPTPTQFVASAQAAGAPDQLTRSSRKNGQWYRASTLSWWARTFPGNPYDGHILRAVLEQAGNLMQDVGTRLKDIVVDLGFRGVDANNPGMTIIRRAKFKSLSATERRWLNRRQAVEPAIGHLKADHRMDRCWLKGETGDALHTLSCAACCNLRWLMRAVVRLGLKVLFLRLLNAAEWLRSTPTASYDPSGKGWTSKFIERLQGTTPFRAQALRALTV
jgi:hypothetical protein